MNGKGDYSPSPEYPVARYRDEWRGEPRRSSKSEGGLASAQFRCDTPSRPSGTAGSFIYKQNFEGTRKIVLEHSV